MPTSSPQRKSRKTQEEIAAELEVSAATLYNWRRQYGGTDTDAAKELKELRE
ncbi:MAG: transposase [Rhodococcus sp. (in: high G+C Gram-positive bacteria)]|uniref:transposase n=1 Tax=Rhodococcus sp. TaxID=1831 RepID=UPI003BB2130F